MSIFPGLRRMLAGFVEPEQLMGVMGAQRGIVLAYLLAHPGWQTIPWSQLESKWGLSFNHEVTRLVDEGYVEEERDGRSRIFRAADEAVVCVIFARLRVKGFESDSSFARAREVINIINNNTKDPGLVKSNDSLSETGLLRILTDSGIFDDDDGAAPRAPEDGEPSDYQRVVNGLLEAWCELTGVDEGALPSGAELGTQFVSPLVRIYSYYAYRPMDLKTKKYTGPVVWDEAALVKAARAIREAYNSHVGKGLSVKSPNSLAYLYREILSRGRDDVAEVRTTESGGVLI